MLAALSQKGIRCHQVKPRTFGVILKAMAEGTVQNIIHKATSRRNSLCLKYRLYISYCSEKRKKERKKTQKPLIPLIRFLQPNTDLLEVNGRIKMLGTVKPKPRAKVWVA